MSHPVPLLRIEIPLAGPDRAAANRLAVAALRQAAAWIEAGEDPGMETGDRYGVIRSDDGCGPVVGEWALQNDPVEC